VAQWASNPVGLHLSLLCDLERVVDAQPAEIATAQLAEDGESNNASCRN
jgi:hypothetical protein